MNILLNAYEYWRYENVNKQTFQQLEKEDENKKEMQERKQSNASAQRLDSVSSDMRRGPKKKCFCLSEELVNNWSTLMSSPQYDLFVNIIGIFNILCIVVRAVDLTDSTAFITYWINIQQIINMLFLIELISDFCVHGLFKSYQQHFRMWPETACQFFSMLALYYYTKSGNDTKEYNTIVKFLELVIFLRMLKLLTLLYEIKVMRIIIETMRNLMKPLLYLTGVLMTIFYVFALIGMLFFGGKVRKNLPAIVNDTSIPHTYHLDNFNDLISSLVTLFTLMVVNNWMVQVQMYVDVTGGNTYVRFYFGIFYYFSVVIGINILVAFAIDMYSSVERLDYERMKTLKMIEDEITHHQEHEDHHHEDTDKGDK